MGDDRLSNTDVSVSTAHGRGRARSDRTTDDLYRLLGSERRRAVLSSLADSDGPVAVDELVDDVAEGERPDPGPGSHRDRITTDLHHVHLPILADAGVIDYDPVAGTVRYDPPAKLDVLVDAIDGSG